jgi:hypothetical protein
MILGVTSARRILMRVGGVGVRDPKVAVDSVHTTNARSLPLAKKPE